MFQALDWKIPLIHCLRYLRPVWPIESVDVFTENGAFADQIEVLVDFVSPVEAGCLFDSLHAILFPALGQCCSDGVWEDFFWLLHSSLCVVPVVSYEIMQCQGGWLDWAVWGGWICDPSLPDSTFFLLVAVVLRCLGSIHFNATRLRAYLMRGVLEIFWGSARKTQRVFFC